MAHRLERCGLGVKDSNVREWPIPAQRTPGPGFDLIASKLRLPPVRSGTIRRSSLIERLTRDDSRSIVSVVAPPGYGKTTLLSHWAERSTQAFAWVSLLKARPVYLRGVPFSYQSHDAQPDRPALGCRKGETPSPTARTISVASQRRMGVRR